MPAAVAGGLYWTVPPLSGRPFTYALAYRLEPAALFAGALFFADLAYIGPFRPSKVAENRQRPRRSTPKTGQNLLRKRCRMS